MRIIAGLYKGQSFKTPPGDASRPTLSRIRESLFDILMPYSLGANFLDAYAGVGGIGLEALSRGAQQVTFIESDRTIAKLLRENADKFDPEGKRTSILERDALAGVEHLRQQGKAFDILFLDPPYRQAEIDRWLQQDWLAELLLPQGMLILQHDWQAVIPDQWGRCARTQARKYGKTILSFFRVPHA